MTRPSAKRGKSIRVLVADSNQTQSQLLSSALRRQAHLEVTCCRGEPSHCLEALRSAPVDVVLLGDSPTHHDHLVDTVFCRSRQSFRALCRCVSVVYQGQLWTNTEQVDYLIEALNSVPHARLADHKGDCILTPREEQIVGLVAEGIGNREVARQLNIKENTVKKALLRVYDKLGLSNRVELVLYVLTHCSVKKRSSPPAKTAAPERLALDCVDRGQVNVLGTDGGCLPKAN